MNQSPPKASVVDDSGIIRIMMRSILADLGFRVDLANDGPHGLKCFQSSGYDLILMDVNLPGLKGFEVTKEIRRLQRGLDMPIVGYSGIHSIRKYCLDSGMDDFLEKPSNLKTLVSVLSKYIPKSHDLLRSCQIKSASRISTTKLRVRPSECS